MTHLSDLSYIQRAVSTSWFYGWFIVYVYRWDRFEAFRWRRLLRFELRSIVTLLILIALGLQLAYEIGSARLKYMEGFWVDPRTSKITAKPAQAWSASDVEHVGPLYYTLACALAFQNCIFFLLLAFWSYISKSVTRTSFMSSFEFKLNIAASCFAVVIFPTVQYLFRENHQYREAVPQMIFSGLMLITGVLGVRTHFRLVALIRNAREIMNETTLNVLYKLEYFKDMNGILTFSLFICALSLGITSADGLLATPVIAPNKFASDVLITNLNFFEFIIWVTLTLIFYPRKNGISSPFGSSMNGSSAHRAGTYEGALPRFNEVRPQDVSAPQSPVEKSWSSRKASHHRSLSAGTKHTSINMPNSPPPPQQQPHDSNALSPSSSSNAQPSDKTPELETRTLYYHEALAKAQKKRQQQGQQNNDSKRNTNATHDTHNDQRNDSHNDNRKDNRNGNTSVQYPNDSNNVDPARPPPAALPLIPPRTQSRQQPLHDGHQRSMSNSSQCALLADHRKSQQRYTPVEYYPRGYTSLDEESNQWANHLQYGVGIDESSGHQMGPRMNRTYTHTRGESLPTVPSGALIRQASTDSDDLSVIQLAYIQSVDPMHSATLTTYSDTDSAPYGSFYDAVGRDDSPIVPVQEFPRPFSPRN
ncbi:hypothetical protein BGW38_001893 [Lunasporangiospora selenospora]|uniref:Uncharacterized protein n=1 Tax=Lunasporangiospora selenospora TaxID=979761 RepID=A0A9P6FTC1_9FUNG|nr:hypothetical protein BGW38_001893 [Lunasporangiospora selenospora]